MFLLAACCYSWNCWPTFFINKKRWENKKR